MVPSSGVWSSPSTVQSTTRPAAASPARTAGFPCSACDAPVERMATGWSLAGVGTTRSNTRPPSDSAARRAVSTSSGRLEDSESTATTSPSVSPHRRSWSAKHRTQRHSAMAAILLDPGEVVDQRGVDDVRRLGRQEVAGAGDDPERGRGQRVRQGSGRRGGVSRSSVPVMTSAGAVI